MKNKLLIYKCHQGNKVRIRKYKVKNDKIIKNPRWDFHYSVSRGEGIYGHAKVLFSQIIEEELKQEGVKK